MNLGQISEYIQRRILKKENYDPEIIRLAVNEAQTEIQRGNLINGAMVQHDWSCMQSHYVREYRPGGILLEDAVTRVRMVYRTHTLANGQVVRSRPLQPSSEDLQDNRIDQRHHDFYPSDIDMENLVRHRHGHICWWIEERKITLSRHAEAEQGLKLWCEVYRILPPLVNPTDENWFTIHAWDALAWKATAMGFGTDVDVEAAAFFEKMAITRIQSAINADQRFQAAGVSDDYLPPRPRPFRVENTGSYD